jgi:hypothetical protein
MRTSLGVGRCPKFLPRGKEFRLSLALPSGGGRVQLWDITVATPRVELTLDGGPCLVKGLTLACDGVLTVADKNGRIWTWDIAAQRLLGDWQMLAVLDAFAASANGRHLAMAWNGVVYVLRLPF